MLDDYLEVRPQARARIEALVRAGRLVIGPWHVLPDEWLVSGESLVRNLRFGLMRAAEFGGGMRLGYVPDQFGHVGQLPQIFAGFGFEAAVLWRGVGDDVGGTVFDWLAPDGSRVFTVFLARGYGNAAQLPLEAEALAARLLREAATLRSLSPATSVLLMNGSDHLEPQPGLPAALAAADLGGASSEIGTLQGFVERARREAAGAVPEHLGELRSGLRSPLLEGCASARMRQKRRDFENEFLLARLLEPLSALLAANGGSADTDVLRFAWKLVLENHPHDSICGCSIDAVHDEMDVRFARTEQLARAELARVTGALAERVVPPAGAATRDGLVLVWNPNAAGAARVEGELPLDLAPSARRPAALHVRTAEGRALPVHAECVDPGREFACYELPANLARIFLGGFPRQFFGLHTNALQFERARGVQTVELQLGATTAAGFDLEAAKREVDRALAALGEERVRYRVRALPRFRLRFVDTLPGWGLRGYRLARGRARGRAEAAALLSESLPDGGARIANGRFELRADPSGRVQWRDLVSGRAVDDAIRFVSEADRGDSYTFDPLPGAAACERPVRARVRCLPPSAAEVGLELDLLLRLPRSLSADRRSRSKRTLDVRARVVLRLSAGLAGIPFSVKVDNRARDHRLRLQLRSDLCATRFEVESAFEVAERPIAPGAGDFGSDTPAERPTGATPQRAFATLTDGKLAFTVANRGCAEVEAIPEEDGRTSLALSVFRAFGWLSRGDLAFRPVHAGPPYETPGGQAQGEQCLEGALFVHADGAPDRCADAHRYAYPPLAFAGSEAGQGELADGSRLLKVDDPAIVVTAAEPQSDGGVLVRLYNASAFARSVRIGSDAFRRLVSTDLAGRPQCSAAAAKGGAFEQAFRPWQIVSLRLD